MSYQKYHTEALVLRGTNIGEADRLLSLYTQEFGLVQARASAMRRETSKMRYALQNYDHASISLVRGNRGWRAAGATALSRIDAANSSGIRAFARIASLVERLVAGEEKNDYLYHTLIDAHAALKHPQPTTHGSVELVCVARTLYALGYLSAEAFGSALFAHTAYHPEDLSAVEEKRDTLLTSVNRAIAATHL